MFFDVSAQAKLAQSFMDAAAANAAFSMALTASSIKHTTAVCNAILKPAAEAVSSAETAPKPTASKVPARAASLPTPYDLMAPWLDLATSSKTRSHTAAATPPAFPENPTWFPLLGSLAEAQSKYWTLPSTAAGASPWSQVFPWLQPAPKPANPAALAIDAMTALTKAAWMPTQSRPASPLATPTQDIMAPFKAVAFAQQPGNMIPMLLSLSATCLGMALPLILTELQRFNGMPGQQLELFPGAGGFQVQAA